MVANVWADVLGVDRVGVHENFFELGGHSLLATRVVSRLRHGFAVDLPVRRIFEMQTVAELAAHLDAGRRTAAARTITPRSARVDRSGPLPLSFAQQRLWFFEQLEPDPVLQHSDGGPAPRALDIGALARASTEIVRRHEALRTVFPRERANRVSRHAGRRPCSPGVEDLTTCRRTP